MRQIAFGLLLLGVGIGPLAPTLESTFILRLLIHLIFVLTGVLWVIGMALEGKVRLRRMGVGTWLLLFCGASVSAAVNASYKYPAVLTAFMWLSSIVAFVFIVNETRSRRRRLLLLGVVCASAFIVSLHALHQLFVELPQARSMFAQDPSGVLRSLNLPQHMAYDLEGRLGKDRVFGTFVLPNSLAGFLVLVTPACLGLLFDTAAGRRRTARGPLIWRGAFVLLMLLALYFTKSKGGWLAFMVAIGAFALWAFGGALWRRRTQMISGLLGLFIVWGMAQASGLLPPLRDYPGSLAVRYGYWRAAATIVERHPFVGVGLDNFTDFYAATKRAADQEARRAHNDYIQMAAETGLIGLSMYIAFWIAFWRRVAVRKGEPVLPESEARPPPGGTLAAVILSAALVGIEVLYGGTFLSSGGIAGLSWPVTLFVACLAFLVLNVLRADVRGPVRGSYATVGIGCGLVGFLAHSLVDFDHYVAGTFATAWIMMGLLLSSCLSEETEQFAMDRPIRPLLRPVIALAAVGIAFFLAYGFVLPASEAHERKERATDLTTVIPFEKRQDELEKAIKKNPWDAQLHALLSDLFLGQWRQGRVTTDKGISAFSQAVVHARQAVELNPVRSEYYRRLGRLYELRWVGNGPSSDYQEALEAYLKAEELFPSHPDNALNLARLYDQAGRYDVALGKYIRARLLSEEQYHIPRKFDRGELKELNARIEALQVAITSHNPPPPRSFEKPRLLGWPPGYAGG